MVPAAGRQAPVEVSRVALEVTEAEVPQTAREVAAAVEAVAVHPVVPEVVSAADVAAAEEDVVHSEVGRKVLLHQREASHKPPLRSQHAYPTLTTSDTPFFELANATRRTRNDAQLPQACAIRRAYALAFLRLWFIAGAGRVLFSTRWRCSVWAKRDGWRFHILFRKLKGRAWEETLLTEHVS
jgi:hypothetical protein